MSNIAKNSHGKKESSTAGESHDDGSNGGAKNKTREEVTKLNKKDKRKAPYQRSDAEFRTPTQLRNARKRRRAKQQKKQQHQHHGNDTTSEHDFLSRNKRPRISGTKIAPTDPSLDFIDNPVDGPPMIQQARSFFAADTTYFGSSNENDNKNNNSLSNKVFPVYLGPKFKWRTMIKLAVRARPTTKKSQPLLSVGMFAPKSHDLIPDSSTSPLHHPALNKAMACLERLARQLQIPAYRESSTTDDDAATTSTTTTTGCLKYVTASVERSSKKVQLTLIWQEHHPRNSAEPNSNQINNNQPLDKLCQALVEESNEQSSESINLHSLWVHYHPSHFSPHNNAIYDIEEGARWETKFGPSCGTKEKLDLQLSVHKNKKRPDENGDEQTKDSSSLVNLALPTLFLPPTVFRQANIDAFGKIVGQIRTFLLAQKQNRGFSSSDKGIRLLELYGGVGTIGLHLVDLCSSFICSDENPNNQACFQRSVESLSFLTKDDGNGDHHQSGSNKHKIRYIPKNATDMVQTEWKHVRKADWIVVDPPRKGMEQAVCQALSSNEIHASVLVYVSCGFAAFQRDYQLLLADRQWELVEACGHVLFPGSNAIETLAFFRRRQPRKSL